MPSKCIFNLQYFLFPHCLELVPVFFCTKNIKAFRRGFYGGSMASICTMSSVFLLFCLKLVLMSPLFYIPTPVIWLQPLFQSSQWYQWLLLFPGSFLWAHYYPLLCNQRSLSPPAWPFIPFRWLQQKPWKTVPMLFASNACHLDHITPASSVPFANPALKIAPISITCDIHTVLAHGYSLLFNVNG